jgi:guanylate cyclase
VGTVPAVNLTTFFAHHPDDSAEISSEKLAAFIVAGSCCVAGALWTVMYVVIFGWGLTAALPLSFVVLVGGALVVSQVLKDHRPAVYIQIFSISYIPALIQWTIGGALESGFVMAWALLGPITALVFLSIRQSLIWLLLFLANLAVTVAFDGYFESHAQVVTDAERLFFFVVNLGASSVVVFAFAGYFVAAAVSERENANRLLLNVLPREIAPILKESDRTIADHYDSASVLFADIVGSTPLFATMEPEEAVDWLNEVFSAFDGLVEDCGLEKIRTIGDNYMVAAGVPTRRPDHANALARLALDMISAAQDVSKLNGQRIEFRIGINSGPLVAGVIGTTKFHYDVWGDTVNVASRMESHGKPGRVHITESTYALIKDDFVCESRGPIEVKGKGEMETWFVKSPRVG